MEVIVRFLFFLQAYLRLIFFDLLLTRGDFNVLYEKVRHCPLAPQSPTPGVLDRVCTAIDMAAIWYWKEVLCLQRAAATACLLKKYGVAAQMVIGAQQLPFKSHAWVEVEGRVVNDKPYMQEMYSVVDRC
jgi:hypothetical protein